MRLLESYFACLCAVSAGQNAVFIPVVCQSMWTCFAKYVGILQKVSRFLGNKPVAFLSF